MQVQARHREPFTPADLPENVVYRKEEGEVALDMNACNVISGHQMRLGQRTAHSVLESGVWLRDMCPNNGFNTFGVPPLPPWNPSMEAESGINYVHNQKVPLDSRKRLREYVGYAATTSLGEFCPIEKCVVLGEDVSSLVQINQSDVDCIVSRYMESVKNYMVKTNHNQMKRWGVAVEQRVAKRIRAREDEITRIGKLNWALEEQIKSLCTESQILKGVACDNEATANSLRKNLQEIQSRTRVVSAPVGQDAQSSCGSTVGAGTGDEGVARERLRCKCCGEGEARVLALPCRHLSMCTVCGSSTEVCPVCRSPKNAIVVVDFS